MAAANSISHLVTFSFVKVIIADNLKFVNAFIPNSYPIDD